MNDTPQYVFDLQLSLWQKKSPMQRLHQFMIDNDAMYKFWNNVKPVASSNNKKIMLTKAIIQSNKI